MSIPIRANLVLNMLFFNRFRKYIHIYIYIYLKFSLICSCFVVVAIVSRKNFFFKL